MPRIGTRPASRTLGVVLTCTAALVAVGTVTGPASAATRAQAFQVKAMTWNACANTAPKKGDDRCRNGRQTAKVAATIRDRIVRNQPQTRVLFLQEVCSVDVSRLQGMADLSGWKWKFTPIRFQGTGNKPSARVTDRNCAPDKSTHAGRGKFGIAVGVRGAAQFKARYYPDAHQPIDNRHKDNYGHWNVRQAVVCASVADWRTTVCGTHLTPLNDKGADPGLYRSAQAAQVRDLMSYAKQGVGATAYGRVLFGGDLNQSAPDGAGGSGDKSTLAPAYAQYSECDQSAHGGKRDGRNTYENAKGTASRKLDYLFTTKGASSKCYVTNRHVSTSDHKPVVDDVTYSS